MLLQWLLGTRGYNIRFPCKAGVNKFCKNLKATWKFNVLEGWHEASSTLGANVNNLVATATWRPRFVHPSRPRKEAISAPTPRLHFNMSCRFPASRRCTEFCPMSRFTTTVFQCQQIVITVVSHNTKRSLPLTLRLHDQKCCFLCGKHKAHENLGS